MIYFLLYTLVMIGVCWLAADIHRREHSGDSPFDDDHNQPYCNCGCDQFIDGTTPPEYFAAIRRQFQEQEDK